MGNKKSTDHDLLTALAQDMEWVKRFIKVVAGANIAMAVTFAGQIIHAYFKS